ncbi:MAG TPA: winged helix-turn-helix transcriptional regulator [Conexibacter sp.]|jgi:DNA-binding HxlR family transcriptional regulator|nr:winged helix-turn-helix transcriptional regulator [Conexibacter sp.]
MASKRSYGDACGIARALDVVGERWALMVVRELLLGPKRFTDIRGGLPHVSPDVLAQRLRDLEQAGVVHHRRLPPPFGSQVYELTASGRALEPVLIELGRWGGANAPEPSDDMCMSLDAYVVSLRTLFDAARAGDFAARIELRLGEERFRVVIADGRIEAGRGELADADAVVESDPTTLIDVLHGHSPLGEALDAGTMRFSGDRRKATRFTKLFPLPVPAAV